MRAILQLLKETIGEWWEDDAPTQAAGVAFYTVFSLAPGFMITGAIASMIYGRETAREEILRIVQSLAGSEIATAFKSVLEQARVGSFLVTTVGIMTSAIGATAALAALQSVMNRVWDVAVRPGYLLKTYFKKRLLSFALVLGGGLLLLIFLATAAILVAVSRLLQEYFRVPSVLLEATHFGLSLAFIGAVFAALFKFLPDAKIRWSDVWVGAAGTSFLFTLGNTILGMYLARSTLGSVYGAAGSLVLLLVWVYYSVQIFIFGAEFTQVYAKRRGIPIEPSIHAVRLHRKRSGVI